MEQKKEAYENRGHKRPIENAGNSLPNKRPLSHCSNNNNNNNSSKMMCEKWYRFRILLPNGLSLELKIVGPVGDKMGVGEFAGRVREEYRIVRRREGSKNRREIDWRNRELCFVDAFENQIKDVFDFHLFDVNKLYILRLNDGSEGDENYENMWDLTPDIECLKELPQEYAFETALADLIDNSLQAVWSKSSKTWRLISMKISEDKISIFDNGPGMDASAEKSIVKWGRMGASLHRSSRKQAVGGQPPYLKPFFGMFGYGGSVSSMHLGRRTLVSSKTKESKKVCTLYLERDALLSSSGSEHNWRTDGGLRDPSDDEIKLSPDGSFTMVEIFDLKMKTLHISQLQCRLKDIYIPYIQCDEVSKTGRTIMPCQFQVNDIDLAEIEGGEVAITNINSCNGPEFVLQLHFSLKQDLISSKGPGLRDSSEANARLRCIYLPIIEGKESVERILETLEAEGCGINETYDSFSHVSIRCLGRLLPDARWAWLPFMEPRHRKGDRAQILKRCCSRVKCFIETDAGFYPNPSKTDLSHHHPYTTALKDFGNKHLDKEGEVHVEIHKDGKSLTLQQMEKQYHEWILQMHDNYDEELDCGVDEPVLIINPINKKDLGISSDVVRVHKIVRRKGTSWESGQKIKILKGACSGVYKNNIYAVIEYFLLEGIQGDAVGESRVICRPIGISKEKGCHLADNKEGNPSLDIGGSIHLPLSVLDSEKCLAVESTEWCLQAEKLRQKTPSSIDMLNGSHCKELGVKGDFPFDATVDAGHFFPDEIVAVVRPTASTTMGASRNIDQKNIARVDYEMALEVKLIAKDNPREICHFYSCRSSPISRKGIHGLYIFSLASKCPKLFEKAGVYTFTFKLIDSNCKNCLRSVEVKALPQAVRWGLEKDMHAQLSVRVGSCFPSFDLACYDRYGNRTTFTYAPKVMVKMCSERVVLLHLNEVNSNISTDKLTLKVENFLVESSELDKIRPSYEANIVICSQDEQFNISIPGKVSPGTPHHVMARPTNFMKHLLPGNVVKKLELEVFDVYDNHVKEDSIIMFAVDGFCLPDEAYSIQKVDKNGSIDLSGLLKVSKGYKKMVSLSVLFGEKVIFREESQTEMRKLRVASMIPENCDAGSLLENVVFEIVNSEGVVDETIDDDETCGLFHTLTLKSETMDIDDSVRYIFRQGRCTVRVLPVPQKEGIYSFIATYTRNPELNMVIKVNVNEAPSDRKVLLLHDSSTLVTSQVDHCNIHDHSPDGALVLACDYKAPNDIKNLVLSVINEHNELEQDICKYGLSVGQSEEKLQKLQVQKSAIEKDLSRMKAFMDNAFDSDYGYSAEKKVMIERIKSKGDSAAAVVLEAQNSEFSDNIVGVVVLLGSVQTIELGRILAEYLGEENLLAVVCKAAASDLEKYDENGCLNHACGLLAMARECGRSLNGRYNTICLEDIRAFAGKVGNDPQRKLLLQGPTLQNGKSPPGFLGYAVNMINIDVHHFINTAAPKGRRETLFYRLFGELQVYESREYMQKAQETSCINSGAVSLDGGIIRGNGLISLGSTTEAFIHFVTPYTQCHSSPRDMHMLKRMAVVKWKLRETIDEIEKEEEACSKSRKKFSKRRDRYTKFLDEKAPLMQNLELSRFCIDESINNNPS